MSDLPRHFRSVRLAVLALVALYATYFSFYSCIAHDRFKTYAYDLGTFDQGIWLAGHSRDLFVTVRGLPLLGDHVRLFSFVLAPLYWVCDDVRALLVLQSVVIALGAWFLWRIAARQLPERPWLVLAIVAGYLLHPAVQNLNLDHAHPDAFASTFILAAIDYLAAGRLIPFAAAAALAMSCKEDVPLVFVAMGVALMFDSRRRRFGALLAVVAGAYFALCMLVILPHFNGVGFFRLDTRGFFAGMGYYGHDPRWILRRLTQPESAGYLFKIGLPNLFLFVFSPLKLLPALPAVMANLLSDAQYTRNLDYHYQTSILPFLYVAMMDVLARLDAWRSRSGGEIPAAAAASSPVWSTVRALASRCVFLVGSIAPVLLFVAALEANANWSKVPWKSAQVIFELWGYLEDDEAVAKIHKLIAQIPGDAGVSADYSLVPHLSHRRVIYMYPNPFQVSYWGIKGENPPDRSAVDYILVRSVRAKEPVVGDATSVVGDNSFERIAGDRDVVLYRRVSLFALSDHASCGDWNGDGTITADDVRSISEAVMQGKDCPLRVCDIDGDGVLRYIDVLRLSQQVGNPATSLLCPP